MYGEPQSRDVLAALLWPDFDQTRARANLRRTLHILNQSPINSWIEADTDRIWLKLVGGIEVDVLTFENLVRAGGIDDLTSAIALYKNEFLAGFFLPDSDPFDEWSLLKRELLQRNMLRALDILTTHHLEAGENHEAERLARRQIEIDSFQEPAWQQLMTALANSDRHTEALTEYEKCQQLLLTELNVQPASETIALARSIRDSRQSKSAPERIQTEQAGDLLSRTVEEPVSARTISPPSPYRGLFAFQEEDAPFFFGRENYIELLANAVLDQSIVPLIGPSGSGKSSVLHAGLIPELRQSTNWIIVTFRPGPHPFQALAAALTKPLSSDLSEVDLLIESGKLATALQSGQVTLFDCIGRLLAKKRGAERVILIADQFEELYSLVPDPTDRQDFLDKLLEVVFMQQFQHDPVFTLVFSLRADFLGQALTYRPLADAIQDVDVKLGPVTQSEMRRAIEKPAAAVGVSFEPGLIPRIMEDVGQQAGRLPLLQFTLDQLWHRQTNLVMTHASYEEIGGIEGALSGYAEQIYAKLDNHDQVRAHRIFVQLVQPGEATDDVRRIASKSELEEAWPLIRHLADMRLVVTSHDAAGEEAVELVHEALIYHWDRLRNWLANDREFRLWQERFRPSLKNWLEGGKQDDDLIRGGVLSTARVWLGQKSASFSMQERDFVERASTLAQKRRRNTLLITVGIFSIVVVLLAAALFQWRNALQARNASVVKLGEQVATQALNQPIGAYDRSLLLAIEAVQIADSPLTKAALTQLLLSNLHIQKSTRISMEQPFYSGGAISPDGQHGIFPAEDALYLWDIESGQRLTTSVYPPDGAYTALADFSPDGQWLAIGQPVTKIVNPWNGAQKGGQFTFPSGQVDAIDLSDNARRLAAIRDGLVIVWDIQSGAAITIATGAAPNEGSAARVGVALSLDGERVSAGCNRSELCSWDSTSGDLVNTVNSNLTGRITQVTYSPDDKILAAGSDDGAIILWDSVEASPITDAPLSYASPVSAMAFSPTGEQLATTYADGTVILWDLADLSQTGTVSQSIMGSAGNSIDHVAFSDTGDSMITVLSENNAGSFPPTTDYVMTIWHPEVRSGLPPSIMLQEQNSGVVDLKFVEADKLIAADSQLLFREDGALIVTDPMVDIRSWSIPDSRFIGSQQTIPIGLNWTGATISSNGRWVAVGPPEGSVLIADLASAELVTQTLEGPQQPVIDLDFSADGRYLAGSSCHEGSLLASTCTLGEAWVWDLENNSRQGPFTGSNDTIGSLALSANGRWLVTSGSELLLWDLTMANPKPELIEEAPGSGPDAFTFVDISPDGQWLSAAQTLGPYLWHLSDTGEWVQWPLEAPLEQPLHVTFDPDSHLLVAGSFSGDLALWDLETGELITRPEKQQFHQVYTLAFNDTGSFLASGSLDGRIVVWDLSQLMEGNESSTELLISRACDIANRNLSSGEWETYFGDQPYHQTCREE